jgi:hypothetical protein
MKSFLIFTVALLLAIISFGQEPHFSVVRLDGTTFICPSLDSAHSKAQDGDKIYLPKGTFNGINISKRLHLIGVGTNTDSAQSSGVTMLSFLGLSKNSSGTIVENIIINGALLGYIEANDSKLILEKITLKNLNLKNGIIVSYPNNPLQNEL